MATGFNKAMARILESDESPWKRCRPANNFKVYTIKQEQRLSGMTPRTTSTLTSHDVRDWLSSLGDNTNVEYTFQLAVVPIVTGRYAHNTKLSLEGRDLLERLFKVMEVHLSTLSCFLDNRIIFTSFPTESASKIVYELGFRQWSLAWCSNALTGKSTAILLWMGGSWARSEIADRVETFVKDIADSPVNHRTPGLLGVLLCTQHVSGSLAVLDEEAFRTERRLREVISGDHLKEEDELGKLSAAHSWLAARAIRERFRVMAASWFLNDLLLEIRADPTAATHWVRMVDVMSLQLLTTSLTAQASKLCDESSIHLATIYNLVAQKDQATNLAISASSREIALQSKMDQTNSLAIAESSKKIAEAARRDSNSMKVVAFVTMLYLPGTFIATCFSMNLFEWSASASNVVSPRIWVYFLFTGILTFLTAGGFAWWLRAQA